MDEVQDAETEDEGVYLKYMTEARMSNATPQFAIYGAPSTNESGIQVIFYPYLFRQICTTN